MEVIRDSVFGEMTYDYSWERKESITLYGKTYDVKIVAKAFDREEISDVQRESYKTYRNNYATYVEQIPQILLKYYLDNYDQISEMVDIPEKIDRNHITEELVAKLIRVRTVYFTAKGKFGWLCDCAWEQEHGIAILLSESVPKVVQQEDLI